MGYHPGDPSGYDRTGPATQSSGNGNRVLRALRNHKFIALTTALVMIVVGYILISTNAADVLTGAASHNSSPPGATPGASGLGASADPSAEASASAPASAAPSPSSTKKTSSPPPKPGQSLPPISKGWPNATNTGVPAGVKLHKCATTITARGTYDACEFDGDVTVRASNVKITRSLINGQVDAGSGGSGAQTGLVISDTTINCGCLADSTQTPAAIQESNFTLLRVNLYNAGHGAAVKSNVVIQDSYIHGLGANTEAHKDGIYSGDGTNVIIRHNNIECNDGPQAGCTAAIGLLTDFGAISYYTIDHNLLNTVGSYCFYGSGGPQKRYSSHHITFTNNHFGRSIYAKCGYYGPVTYFDVNGAGNVWSGNVWDDTGATVPPSY
jgi:hypothetical protein